MNTVKDIVREAIVDGNEISIYNLPDVVINWPEVPEPDAFDDEEVYNEPLDLENWEIISISDDQMVMCAGGDWQEPLSFILEKNDEKTLKVIDIQDGYEEGMWYEDILKALTK